MTRLAVTADLHASDYGRRIDPATGLNARFLDAVGIARWVAEDARARGCDALVVAGDVCEERHPAPWRVAMIREALAAFGGPTILVRGNHDGERAGRSVIDVLAGSLPDGRGFGRPGVTWVGDDVPGWPGSAAVCALPYLDRHWLRAQEGFADVPEADVLRVLGEQWLAIARGLYAEALEEAGPVARESVAVVLVCHQALSGGRMSEQQEAFLGDMSLVVDTGALVAIGFDAVLAGHFHRQQVLHERPLVAYAGSPHRVDFGEEAGPAKVYRIIDADELRRGGYGDEVVPTPARPFVTVEGSRIDEPWEDRVEGTIVRVRDLPPDADAAAVRRRLEAAGAFEVTEVRMARAEAPEAAGMSESLTAAEALEAYFDGDPDRGALLDRGRAILAEVGS